MGLERFIKGRQINVIQWDRSDSEDVLFCFNEKLDDIRIGSKLIVSKGQIAFIIDENQLRDLFDEGTYYLDEKAMPIMMDKYKGIDHSLKVFRATLFFVSITPYNCQWPTDYSLTVTDNNYANINIKLQGDFSIDVTNSSLFSDFIFKSYINLSKESHVSVKKMEGILEEQLRMILGESPFTLAEIHEEAKTISEKLSFILKIQLKSIGLSLNHLNIKSIELPDSVMMMIEETIKKERLIGKLDRVSVRTCNKCGVVLSKEAQFCSQCGTIYTK